MTPTHTKKPVNVRAFVFNGHIDCLDQDHVNAKLIKCDNTFDDCINCEHPIESHAYIKTISGEAIVCPGDYVINNPQFPDNYYPCKPDVFESTYDNIEHKTASANSYGNTTHNYEHEEISLKALKLRAAEVLLDNGLDDKDRKVSLDFIKQLIKGNHPEPEDYGMLFGEVMALINEDSEILVSRKAYDIDYIYFNSETSQFMAYKNGEESLHSFDTKDYTANDWYIVN